MRTAALPRSILCAASCAALLAWPLLGIATGQPKSTEPQEAALLREEPTALVQAARTAGDPNRGAVLFYQPQLSCTKCHTCGGRPGESPLGPDLAMPEPGASAERIVESLLSPSKSIRKGYEAITLRRTDGTIATGLLVEQQPASLVLRDATAPDKTLTIPIGDIEQRTVAASSLMPSGLVNQLVNRQQFLDLVAFLSESAEFGPARARSLRPDPSIINPPLPPYEADIDHAGLIAGLSDAAFRRGEALYARICASCHGTKEQPGSMPTSLRFAEGKFKNGSDPASLYRTLTRGFGMMAAQTNLVPREKYDVIHYIRESLLRPHNPTQYVTADAAYIASLPAGSSRGPAPPEAEPWRKADYGPTLTGTFEIGKGGENIAYKGVAVRLDEGPGGIAQGRSFMLFEHDTLRMAAAWTGEGFSDWNGINFNGKHEIHPRIVGTVQFETAAGPGWANPETGSFDDPRPKGRDGKAYGPLPRSWGRFKGLYHHGSQAVLSYSIGSTEVLESQLYARDANHAGYGFTRTFEIGPRKHGLTLRLVRCPKPQASVRDFHVSRSGEWSAASVGPCDTGAAAQFITATVVNKPKGAEWSLADDDHLLLGLPAGNEAIRFAVALDAGAVSRNIKLPPNRLGFPSLTSSGPRRWEQTTATSIERGADDLPFAVDTLTAPHKNPWSAQMRLTGLDFLGGGKELAVCTWDGDVWRVTGLERADGVLSWRRIASGLFQPLGLKVVDETIYVGCRDQIVILRDLNDDGEADFYDCFNSDHQVTESFHEFAMGLQTDAAGNFYYTKAARHGKTAIVPQHGTLLRVSPNGQQTDILATGFRAPNGVCVNPDGTFFVTDQEGFWMPKNRLNWVRPGGRFFGNLWGYTDITDPSDTAQEEPLCWITNRFDRSPAELLWVNSKKWGGLDGALLNLSYGAGRVYVVPHERAGDGMQGGMVALPLPPFATGVMRGRINPLDGQLYVCGMYAWAGNQQAPGGLYRIRATGKPAYLPVGYHVTAHGIELRFSDPLHAESAADPRNFGLKVWDLVRSQRYGSPHVNERPLSVSAAHLSADQRTLRLTIPGLQPTRGLELWYTVRGADGREVDGLLHGSVHQLAN